MQNNNNKEFIFLKGKDIDGMGKNNKNIKENNSGNTQLNNLQISHYHHLGTQEKFIFPIDNMTDFNMVVLKNLFTILSDISLQ